MRAPVPPTGKWAWEGSEDLAEIYVVVAPPDAPALIDLSRLLSAIRGPAGSAPLRQRQVAALRHWIDAHTQVKTTSADYSIKSEPVEIGGIVRGPIPGEPVALLPKTCSIMRIALK
jgi:hypothetical protein